jgi:hypothetical protein
MPRTQTLSASAAVAGEARIMAGAGLQKMSGHPSSRKTAAGATSRGDKGLMCSHILIVYRHRSHTPAPVEPCGSGVSFTAYPEEPIAVRHAGHTRCHAQPPTPPDRRAMSHRVPKRCGPPTAGGMRPSGADRGDNKAASIGPTGRATSHYRSNRLSFRGR